MEKDFQDIPKPESKKSLKYWLSRPVEERLAEVERLRNEYLDAHPELPRRMAKVVTIVNMKTGEIKRTWGNPNEFRE